MPTSPRIRYKGRGRTGGVEPRPYESVTRGAMRGGIPQSRLRRSSPFRQGGRGDGGTDCHDQFANWSRNDTVNKRCGTSLGGRGRPPPLRSVTRGAAKRGVEDAAPYGCIIDGAVGRADVGIGPYEDVTSSAVGYWAAARVAPGNDRFFELFFMRWKENKI